MNHELFPISNSLRSLLYCYLLLAPWANVKAPAMFAYAVYSLPFQAGLLFIVKVFSQ